MGGIDRTKRGVDRASEAVCIRKPPVHEPRRQNHVDHRADPHDFPSGSPSGPWRGRTLVVTAELTWRTAAQLARLADQRIRRPVADHPGSERDRTLRIRDRPELDSHGLDQRDRRPHRIVGVGDRKALRERGRISALAAQQRPRTRRARGAARSSFPHRILGDRARAEQVDVLAHRSIQLDQQVMTRGSHHPALRPPCRCHREIL